MLELKLKASLKHAPTRRRAGCTLTCTKSRDFFAGAMTMGSSSESSSLLLLLLLPLLLSISLPPLWLLSLLLPDSLSAKVDDLTELGSVFTMGLEVEGNKETPNEGDDKTVG